MSERVSSERHNSLTGQGDRLAARRRKRRRRVLTAIVVVIFVFCVAALYGLHQPAVRISRIDVFGGDTSLAAVARQTIQGTYVGMIPRDSIFFFSESRIRAALLATHPGIAAVSVFRSSLTSLSIKINSHIPIARWCGSTYAPRSASTSDTASDGCYVFDDSGYVFATTSETPLINSFVFYEPPTTSGDPLGSILPHVTRLPDVFNFARQLATLGSSVSAVAIRDGEVDNYLESGTRITYVLGHEQTAFTALVSAKKYLNLTDGSIDYIDLRFDGKMYLKKKVDSRQKTVNSQ